MEDYPRANRFDEVEALVVFDDVLIPWEDVFFYRHTRAAQFIRGTLHRVPLLNSDYAGHRLAFAQFAHAPHFNHLAAVNNSFDFSGPLDFVRRAANLSPRVMGRISIRAKASAPPRRRSARWPTSNGVPGDP